MYKIKYSSPKFIISANISIGNVYTRHLSIVIIGNTSKALYESVLEIQII